MAIDALHQILDDQILQVIDVGARGALCPQFLPIAAKTEVLGFEPDSEECDRLNAELQKSTWKKAEVLPYALAESSAKHKLYITRNGQLTSLLEPNPRVMTGASADVIRTIEIETKSLDDLSRDSVVPGACDFIKLDTQGSELGILQGGESRILPRLLGIEAEIEFVEAYKGQPLFSEVESYLRRQSFELVAVDLFKLSSAEYEFGRAPIGYGNAIFLRGASWLEEHEHLIEEPGIRKLVTLYLVYGLQEPAIKLIRQFNPSLESSATRYYYELIVDRRYWRLALLRDFVFCMIAPTRNHRIRLARRAKMIQSRKGWHWYLTSNTN